MKMNLIKEKMDIIMPLNSYAKKETDNNYSGYLKDFFKKIKK